MSGIVKGERVYPRVVLEVGDRKTGKAEKEKQDVKGGKWMKREGQKQRQQQAGEDDGVEFGACFYHTDATKITTTLKTMI